VWILPDGVVGATETGELSGLKLDDDGNAFVVLLGGPSCAPGTALIEASLENAPYTTYKTTFTVEAPRPTFEEANYTIEKLQKTTGEYTKSELMAKVGETVHYEVIVKNTGEVPLKFTNFKDPGCTNIKGGATELQPGQSATWTCEHKITEAGTYTNVATIEGGDGTGTKESNEVIVTTPKPLLKIEKLQRFSGAFTKEELTGTVGETVHYEIIVTNEGNVTLKLSNFHDVQCTSIAGGASELKPGASTTWTCEHKLTEKGKYVNAATVEANEGVGKKESNQVVVKVVGTGPGKGLAFTIHKLQEIAGSGKGFTTKPLQAKLGETVLYKLIVTNTGAEALTFSKFTDTFCENIKGGPGLAELLPGESTTWTCEHLIVKKGTWYNYGTVTGTNSKGAALTHTSNEVVVYDP